MRKDSVLWSRDPQAQDIEKGSHSNNKNFMFYVMGSIPILSAI